MRGCLESFFSFGVIIFLASLVMLALALYKLNWSAEKVSRASAPAIILLTFAQQISVFLELPMPWPPGLQTLMQYFNLFNFNIELARPECSVN